MRHVAKLMSTGCFFLCLGGWVYSGSVNGADLPAESAKPTTERVLERAVAAAAKGVEVKGVGVTDVKTDAIEAAPVLVAQAPATPATPATQPAAEEPTNLNKPKVAVDPGGNVDFSCQDLDVNTALHFLSLQTKKNIIASKDVKGTVTANLYNVSFQDALKALLVPNGFDYVERGNFIYVYTQKEMEDIRKRDRKPANRIFRLHHVTAADASVLIKPLLTPAAIAGIPEGATDTGGSAYATNDTLVINDFPENLTEIDRALRQLDVRPKQVMVESTILRATLKEDNALGVDFVSLSGIDFSTLTSAAATNNVIGAPGSLAGKTVANDNSQGNVGTDFASKVPQGGLSVGFLSNNVSVFLRALEEITDTTVVANPKILALNKHRGEVFIGQQFGYKTTTTTQTTTQETVQFLDTGTKLVFRPYIGDDGYVRLEIHPEDSAGGLDNGLPQKQSTEVTSNLMVKDGRTVVIGGLFREQTTAGRGQVPVLGNIPVLGVPFRRTNDSTQRTETIVLITPHIINDDTSLYTESEKAANDAARMMMGNRAGLQPWGRDRIAQLWYGKAQDSLEKGDTEKAKMYNDWAINANPRFIEAIKLREQLTRKKVAEADQSSIHTFAKDVIRGERAVSDNGEAGHYLPATTLPAATAPATQP